MDKKTSKIAKTSSIYFPPVVAVLGHVDHGKTSLLDAMRKTNIATKEHGGITQSIGASFVEGITFIDTPGHEAFSKMRHRGATAADIGLLVISSVDGIMPQTKESIQLLQNAKVPFIVVLTKADLPDKNREKIKQQLIKENVVLEGYGGDIPVIEVSAKAQTNIKELLDLILLVWDVHMSTQKKEDLPSKDKPFRAIIIESKLDQKSGVKATIVVKNGNLMIRDELVSNDSTAKVKALINTDGKQVKQALAGDAVEILGFEKTPSVGSIVLKKQDAVISSAPSPANTALAKVGYPGEQEEGLSIVLCADTLGSLEAVTNALPPQISVISQKTGEINPSDILLAKSTGALLIGFAAKVKPEVLNLARIERVIVKNYFIIYELLDELKDVLEGKKELAQEELLGKAKIMARFPFEKTEVLGISVLEGRAAKGDRARLIRKEEILGESHVSSVRQGKQTVSKVEKGQEAGITLSPFLDFTIGDVLLLVR